MQLVAQVAGAVWYATGYLHSLYTAAGHSILAFFGGFCPPWTAASKRLSQSPGRHGIGTSWLQLVAVVPGAVWYATGYLHSLYTAAEHSISPLQQQATACPWHPAAATDERIERLPVMLQAVARCGWFISCLGLSDMPIPTPIAYFPPQSTRFWRFSGFFALRGPRHRNGSLSRPAGMGSAPAGCS